MSVEAAAAAAAGGASLAGSILDYQSDKKLSKDLQKQADEKAALIAKYGGRSVDALTPGYQNAQNIRGQVINRNLGLTGETFKPMLDATQAGDYMAQQAIMAGLQGQRNAILGDPIDYSALSPQNVPIDYSALTGLTNPAQIDFVEMQAPQFGDTTNTQAQQSWTSGEAAQYLANYPDLTEWYEANKEQLIKDSGNPIFNSLEGYAKYHWDNFGKAEGRTFAPLDSVSETVSVTETTGGTKQPATFTSEQVKAAISNDFSGGM